ncbi:hypothetical protein FS749_007470 [Ceratobasidium sp. UAMH 11750]|nr:hypothetical protein FS749_007470 [Ceratobasidium sp. UAMH 11750]
MPPRGRSYLEYPYVCTNPRCKQVFKTPAYWRVHCGYNRLGCTKFKAELRVHHNRLNTSNPNEAETEQDYAGIDFSTLPGLNNDNENTYDMFRNPHWDDSLPAPALPNIHTTPSYPPVIPSAYNNTLPVDLEFFKMMNPWADMESAHIESLDQAHPPNFGNTG